MALLVSQNHLIFRHITEFGLVAAPEDQKGAELSWDSQVCVILVEPTLTPTQLAVCKMGGSKGAGTGSTGYKLQSLTVTA